MRMKSTLERQYISYIQTCAWGHVHLLSSFPFSHPLSTPLSAAAKWTVASLRDSDEISVLDVWVIRRLAHLFISTAIFAIQTKKKCGSLGGTC